MFIISDMFLGIMKYIIAAISPALIIALIVALIVHINSDSKAEAAQTENKQKNNNAAANVLLYLGSFFVFMSFIYLLGDNPSFMPPLLLIATSLCYAGGLLLYKTVKYLRPVALAFTYTSLALLPFWQYAFQAMNLPDSVSLFLAVFISLFACAGAAVAVKSRIAGWLSYLWLVMSGWAFAGMIDAKYFSSYMFFLWPLIVSAIPAFLWSKRIKWLPVAFRHATRGLGIYMTPVILGLSTISLLFQDTGVDYPFLRTAVFGIGSAIIIGQWAIEKKNYQIIISRLSVQMLLIMIVADIMNYSIIGSNSHTADMAMAIVWMSGFLLQALYTLIWPMRDKESKQIEGINTAALVISIVGIVSTSGFCLSFSRFDHTIIDIIMAAIIAIIGVAAALRYRNPNWGIATAIALSCIPTEIFEFMFSSKPESWIIIVVFSIISLLYLGIYASIKNIQPKKSFTLACVALGVNNGLALFLCKNDWWSLSCLLTAAEFAALAGISGKRSLFEPSLYIAVASGYFYVIQLLEMIGSQSTNILSIAQANIVGLPVFGMGLYVNSKHKDKIARMVTGFVLYNLFAFTVIAPTFKSMDSALACQLIYLFELAVFIIVGVAKKLNWLIISSAILAGITVLSLTDGPSYLWLAIIGLALIAAVIVILTRNNQKQNGQGQNQGQGQEQPEAPKQIADKKD